MTGNTVTDTLLTCAAWDFDWERSPLSAISRDRRLILVTAHRRESFGELFLDIWGPAHQLLAAVPNITLLEPLDYLSFVHLMKASYLVLTDSGDVQEEAPGLGKPVFVMRQTTEQPEGIAAGAARLVGTARAEIVAGVTWLMDDPEVYRRMAQAVTPYGDDHAGQRTVEAILNR